MGTTFALDIEMFVGHWVINRVIDDRRDAQTGQLTGTALFEAQDRDVRYSETGLLRMGTASPVTATRRYVWTKTDSNLISVLFDDGQPFHSFSTSMAKPKSEHQCGDDHYHVAYDFSHWPEWTAQWTVTGPRKDFVMTTDYSEFRQLILASTDRRATTRP